MNFIEQQLEIEPPPVLAEPPPSEPEPITWDIEQDDAPNIIEDVLEDDR